MKHHLLFLALILTSLNCKKFEGEYTINCQFTPDYGEGRLLLVTNYKGETIGKFDIPEGVSTFSEKLQVTDANAPEYYDLHLIDTGECYTNVYSHLAVPNGASVFLDASSLDYSYTTNAYSEIRIQGIESLDSLHWIGWGLPSGVAFSQAEKKVDIGFYRERSQGILLRLRANGESQFKTLFIPDTNLSDTLNQVFWQDFKPEADPVNIELPDNQSIQFLEIDGTTLDFKHSVKIRVAGQGSVMPQFVPPAGLSEPLAYRVKIIRLNDQMEKIFLPGEPLRFEATDMRIDEFTVNNRNVTVKTSGDADLIRVNLFQLQLVQNQQYCAIFWQISGAVETFENAALPSLKAYLPDWLDESKIFQSGSATACQFGKQDYPQIREGFPYKSTEPFAVARSGYRSITKQY